MRIFKGVQLKLPSGLFQKLGAQHHLNPVNAAFNLIFINGKFDVFYYRSPFQGGGTTPHFQVFYQGNAVPVLKKVAVAVAYFHVALLVNENWGNIRLSI